MSCRTGKVQYWNRKQARAKAKRLHDNALGAYKCPYCGWFHIGHKPDHVRNGEVDKDAWLNATRPKRRRRTA